ncbi:hypothetical protein [Rodentibacter haemolyticus]|uniref:Uncharacterized protein n=1 Tax=Rodentibacter haemolyticus TaxID=2778911 RepID=A0ABX6UYF8_9PAST|nr:hypothetical protein [Rodentibacter haemolyticus]QPB42829.1 hypothetical protein IHV77_01505 [Rodentibacter haemolyticus]
MNLTIKYQQRRGETLYSWDYLDNNGYILAFSKSWFNSLDETYSDFLYQLQGISVTFREAEINDI